MKTKSILQLAYLLAISACISLYLTSCGDPDIVPSNILHRPDKNDANLISNLNDTTKDINGVTFTSDQLTQVDSSLADFKGKITIYAFAGRSETTTRPIVILTQSLFGEDLTATIDRYISNLNASTKSTNTFILIDDLKTLPNRDGFFLKKADDKANPKKITLNRYSDIHKHYIDLFSTNQVNDVSALGAIYYVNSTKDGIGVYNSTLNEVSRVKALIKSSMHFNTQKLAVVAFDPFMSTVSVSLVQKLTDAKVKLTDAAIVAPILAFDRGLSYPTDDTLLTTSALNVGYKLSLTDINNRKDEKRKDLAFDVLRVGGDPQFNFFASLMVKESNAYGSESRQSGIIDTASKIKDVKFYVAIGGDKATDGSSSPKG